jgi:subtilase family serine protease
VEITTVGASGELDLANGTSFATPMVAGVCALLAALRPNLTQAEAQLLLCAGADDQVGDATDLLGFDTYHGWGRLNAYHSLLLATTRVDQIRHTHGVTELSWRGPVNAAGKRPFQVAVQTALNAPWMVSTQTNTFRYSADRIVWQDDVQATGAAGETRFYKLQLRPLP